MKALFILAFIFASRAIADLPATLKPYAEQYDRDRMLITTSAETALKPARDRYLAALAAAQKVAAAALKTGDIAAITAEVAGANAGAVAPEFPPDLPRSLITERRYFVAAATAVSRSIPPKLRELAAKYLQTLAALDAQAIRTTDAPLTAAVAAERQRIVPHMESAGGGQKNRNVLDNSDFSAGKPGEWPPGWSKSVKWKQASDVALMREGNDQFVRFRRLQATRQADLSPEKEVPIPARSRSVDFSVRIRVKGLTPGKDYDKYPSIKVSARDAAGEKVADEHAGAEQDCGWKKFSGRCAIPETAKTLRIEVGPLGAAGVIDFDDVVVEFK